MASVLLMEELYLLARLTGSRCAVMFISSRIKHSTSPSSIAVFWKNDALQCIDAALLRPGRFDIKVCVLTSQLGDLLSCLAQIAVPPPNSAQRQSILSAVAGEMQVAESFHISALVTATEGWSGAEVAAILRDAATAAIRENVDAQFIEARHVSICN